MFFCIQKRRGHGEGRGLAARVIGTLDSIRESKVCYSVVVCACWDGVVGGDVRI